MLYDVEVEAGIVKIEAIGYKEGNQLFIRGAEYQLGKNVITDGKPEIYAG